MTNRSVQSRDKIEVLTANYPIAVKLDGGSKKQLVGGGEEAGD
jgi:hypothetical protein